jgi:hypothetical protein
MKEYLKALQLLSTQIHCDGMAHNGTPAGPTFRYMLQKLVDSTKAEDYIEEEPKASKRMYTNIKDRLEAQAKKKFPETNSNDSSLAGANHQLVVQQPGRHCNLLSAQRYLRRQRRQCYACVHERQMRQVQWRGAFPQGLPLD